MDDMTRQALADGILAGLACYGTDGQAWRGAEPRDLARHLALWGGGEAAATRGRAPAGTPLAAALAEVDKALAEVIARWRATTPIPGSERDAGVVAGLHAAAGELSGWLRANGRPS